MNGTSKADVLNGTAADDKHYGLAGDDTLYGGEGNDYLDGGVGDDLLYGGVGNDTYIVDSAGDLVVEAAGEGTDEVRTTLAAYTLTANVETLRGLSATGQALFGNDLANMILGGTGVDRLSGGGGNDNLNGGDGDDRISGGVGDDQLNGANGIDTATYADAGAGITVSLATTKAQATGGAGSDILSNIENLEGSAFADVLTGSALANRLDGGVGTDQLFGGAGDDVLVGSAQGATAFDLLDGGADRDTVVYAGARSAYTVSYVGTEVRVGEVGGSGYDVLRNVEMLSFSDGNLVLGANTAPVATADAATLAAGQSSVSGNLLANDSDADGDPLGVVAGTYALTYGSVTVAAGGGYTYTAAAGDRAAAVQDRYTYQVSDGRGGTASATLTVTLPQTVAAPAAVNDTGTTDEDSAVLLDVLANDTGAGLTLASSSVTSGAGTVAIQDGKLRFDPRGGWDSLALGASGTATLAYTATDSYGRSSSASVQVTIAGANDAPTGHATAVLPAGSEGTAYTVTAAQLLAGFTDVDGDPLAATGITASSGIVTVNSDGSVTIAQSATFTGTVSLAYQVADPHGAGVAGALSYTVGGVNHAPVASADTISATEDTALVIQASQLLGNDTDRDGDSLTITAVTAGNGGSATLNANGTITFRPDADFNGPAHFTYTAADSAGLSSSAEVTIAVAAVNDAPTARADTLTATEDTPLVIQASQLLANDSDRDGDTPSITGVTSGTGGTATLNGDGTITFRPVADFNGVAHFTYTLADAGGLTSSADVAVTVQPVNDAPVVQSVPTSWSITAGQAFSFTLPAHAFVDTDGGQAISYALAGGPSWLGWNAATRTLSGTAPGDAAAGTLALTLTGSEPDGLSASAALAISVQGAQPTSPGITPPVSMTNGLIFVQRDGTSGGLAYTGDSARVLKNGQVVVDWTSGGTLAGIPQGDGYTLQVRTGTVVASQSLAVGVVVEALGQSNMSAWFTDASAAYDGSASVYQWFNGGATKASYWTTGAGAGTMAFADTLRAALGDVPVAIVNGSSAGSRLTPGEGVKTWSDTGTGTFYQNAVDLLNKASGGRAEVVIWNQGETDAGIRGLTAEQYSDALKALMARTVTDMGNPYFVIAGLSHVSSGDDIVRAGQAMAAQDNTNAIYVPTSTDMETIGGTHLTSVGHSWQGIDVAQAALDHIVGSYAKSVVVNGASAGDTLTGGAAIDRFQGNAGNDVLTGLAGNDLLRGQTGDDSLYGGVGNDSLSGGIDNDLLDGGADNDDLFGDDGNDQIFGGAGNDYLDGNLGNDAMAGGAGDDRYVVDSAGDTVTEMQGSADAGGLDRVYASVNFTLSAYVEELFLTGSANINGTGNALANSMSGNPYANALYGLAGDDKILGQAGDDSLYGGDGNDTLTGGPGTDALFGGAGDDIYAVDSIGDTADERVNGADAGGNDTVQSAVSFVLGNFIETLQLTGAAATDGTGNAQANAIRGNNAANTLSGADGNDTLQGNAGDDKLYGGSGADLLQGGDGKDVIIGGLGVDRMTGDNSVRVADTFVFLSAAETGAGAGNRDVITDFDAFDRIDLSAVDANALLTGQQHFSYIGTAAFSAVGQLRIDLQKGYAVLEGDLNGDGVADFQIELTGVTKALDAGVLLL